ncbi:MAG: cobalamin-dependent protein [Desulfobacteraceae bacterium]|jgi:methylmalonyl-CoA mutase C-terminal domain/subunit
MSAKRKLRILTGKMGLDCHDNGIVAISALMKERGHEVIYLGLHNSAPKILNAAQQEDVDVIGLSFLCGTHMPRIRELVQLMDETGVHFPLIVGGVIPSQDAEELERMGIRVFLPGTPIEEIEKNGVLAAAGTS